jgi:hypothetical protein
MIPGDAVMSSITTRHGHRHLVQRANTAPPSGISIDAMRSGWRMMEIENFIRYAPRAVGLKPSAIQGEARLRGLERMTYSETMRRQPNYHIPA